MAKMNKAVAKKAMPAKKAVAAKKGASKMPPQLMKAMAKKK